MNTKNLSMIVIGSSICGAVCAAIILSLFDNQNSLVPKDQSAVTTRIDFLQTQLDEERQQREQLQEFIAQNINRPAATLTSPASLPAVTVNAVLDDGGQNFTITADQGLVPEVANALSATPPQSQLEIRKQRLISSGFAEEEANWIFEKESEVSLESLNDQYQARRQALLNQTEGGANNQTTADRLRTKLGDQVYERYLEANGWPTSVAVGSVMPNSPGQNAGLQAGDSIVAYNGERVFSVRELNNLTVQGDPGESILIEVERDGNPVQLTIPRGPIGVTANRRNFSRARR